MLLMWAGTSVVHPYLGSGKKHEQLSEDFTSVLRPYTPGLFKGGWPLQHGPSVPVQAYTPRMEPTRRP